MPLTEKGKKVLAQYRKQYGKRAEEVFYRSINAGKLHGMERRKKKKKH